MLSFTKTNLKTNTNIMGASGINTLTPSMETEILQVNELKPVVSNVMIKSQETTTSFKFKPSTKSRSKTSPAVLQKPKQEPVSIVDTLSSQKQEQSQSQRVSQLFKQAKALKSKQESLQTSINTNINIPKPETRFPIIKVPSFVNSLSKKAKEGNFDIFVTKKGKIGSTKTKTEAKNLLENYLGKTLSASGFIEKSGKKLKVSELGISTGFRKSKSNSFKVVEKKSRRLRKGGTGKDIQFFR